jgi:carboxypeptidase family protein
MRPGTALLWAAVVMAPALPASAQQAAAEIRGRVLDGREGLLPQTGLALRNQETGLLRQVVSGADGTYFLSGVAPGLYELSAERPGFKKYSRALRAGAVPRTGQVGVRLVF